MAEVCLVYGPQIKSFGTGGHDLKSDIHHNYLDAKAGGLTSVQGEMLPVVNLYAAAFFMGTGAKVSWE